MNRSCEKNIYMLFRMEILLEVLGIILLMIFIKIVKDNNIVIVSVIFFFVLVGSMNIKMFSSDSIEIGRIVEII